MRLSPGSSGRRGAGRTSNRRGMTTDFAKWPCVIPGGRASVRAGFLSSPGGSPSRNRATRFRALNAWVADGRYEPDAPASGWIIAAGIHSLARRARIDWMRSSSGPAWLRTDPRFGDGHRPSPLRRPIGRRARRPRRRNHGRRDEPHHLTLAERNPRGSVDRPRRADPPFVPGCSRRIRSSTHRFTPLAGNPRRNLPPQYPIVRSISHHFPCGTSSA